jgi:uncharacterized protein YjiS (DUF1127 family)
MPSAGLSGERRRFAMREAAFFIARQESVASSLLSSLAGSVARFYRTWRTRRGLVQMTDLDDHILDDIGVTRADIQAVLSRPYVDSPALELQRIAQRNRARWRRL